MSMIHPGYNLTSPPNSKQGDPAWEVAFFYPPQGNWSECDYLRLDQAGGRIVELVRGRLEVLPMPTILHQLIAKFLFARLDVYVGIRRLGTVLFAPLPVHLGPEHYREPDIVFFRPERVPVGKEYPELADLVMEIVRANPMEPLISRRCGVSIDMAQMDLVTAMKVVDDIVSYADGRVIDRVEAKQIIAAATVQIVLPQATDQRIVAETTI